jgi:hypothetical protein
MTYEELVAILDDLDVALNNGFGKASTFIACTKAVRNVIELHKPFKTRFELGDEYLACQACEQDTNVGAYQVHYPCPTIQAIEKELK